MIREIKTVVFSPTGNTNKLVQKAGAMLAKALDVPVSSDDFTLPEKQTEIRNYDAGTFVIFGTPTYAGRVPNKALPFVQNLFKGQSTCAMALVTFGNRSYDSSLTELSQELGRNGFIVITAGAFASPHAFAAIGLEHPDAEDNTMLESLITGTAEILKAGKKPEVIIKDRASVAPYYIPMGEDGQPAKFLKAKPKTDLKKCDHCGKCAKVCPMGSIAKENTDDVPGICIKCQACIKYCPKDAKYFDDPRFLSHKAMLEKNYRKPAHSEIFIGA
jgi:ferredoxin/flavodoxin